MKQNSQDFSIQKAQQLANTPEGQKLVQLLQQKDSTAFQKATEAASSGNYTEAGKALSALLSSPEVRQLIQQMGGKYGGL